MPAVCFYFQVHQPYRLAHYPASRIGRDHDYFDDKVNGAIMRKVAAKCYLPANRLLLDLIRESGGRFRAAFSISGIALEQMVRYAPEALASFQELAATGAVEFLGETHYHSLAAIHSEKDFVEQVRLHSSVMEKWFGQTPRIFRNTELIYNDRIGEMAARMGFAGVLAEGADDVLQWRSPNYVYRSAAGIGMLLKNYRLSDDVAFRFSNTGWAEYPLTAPKFASWIHRLGGNGETVNLFMDYETFGEHQWESTGVFDFVRHLPGALWRHPDWEFMLPSEVLERYNPVSTLPFPRTVSWADIDRDLSAWSGNHMQQAAFRQIYGIEAAVRERNNPASLDLWRKLQTSDHFYYMCTKWFADGDVHAYFSHYGSPYDAFINYMNALTDFRENVLGVEAEFMGAA